MSATSTNTPEQKLAKSPELTLFNSTMSSLQYVFRDGVTAVFREGRYATSKKKHIDELQAEVDENHPFIFIDPNKKTITQEELKPDYDLRQKIRAELMAEMAGQRDFGTSDKSGGPGTGVATTANVGQAVIGTSEGGVSAAKLVGLGSQSAQIVEKK